MKKHPSAEENLFIAATQSGKKVSGADKKHDKKFAWMVDRGLFVDKCHGGRLQQLLGI
jgi:hypothetical protein